MRFEYKNILIINFKRFSKIFCILTEICTDFKYIFRNVVTIILYKIYNTLHVRTIIYCFRVYFNFSPFSNFYVNY